MLDLKEWIIIYRYWETYCPNDSFIKIIVGFTFWSAANFHIYAHQMSDDIFYWLILAYIKTRKTNKKKEFNRHEKQSNNKKGRQ